MRASRCVVLLLLLTAPRVARTRCGSRLKAARDRFALNGLVQIHHIYPKQFRHHPLLRDYDIDSASNLVMMPTKRGKQTLRLRDDWLVHDGGHSSYNRYVGKYLSFVSTMPTTHHLSVSIKKAFKPASFAIANLTSYG